MPLCVYILIQIRAGATRSDFGSLACNERLLVSGGHSIVVGRSKRISRSNQHRESVRCTILFRDTTRATTNGTSNNRTEYTESGQMPVPTKHRYPPFNHPRLALSETGCLRRELIPPPLQPTAARPSLLRRAFRRPIRARRPAPGTALVPQPLCAWTGSTIGKARDGLGSV